MSTTQKVIKYVAIAFAISLIVGIFSFFYRLGFFVGDILGSNHIEDNDFNIENFKGDVAVLNVDLRFSKLTIQYGEELSVKTNNTYIETKQKNNKLSVVEKGGHHWNHHGKNMDVIITIPKDLVFDIVNLSNGAGTIDIESLQSKKLDFDLGAGKVDIHSLIVSKEAEIDTGAGELTIENAELHNLSLDLGVGKCSLSADLVGESEIDAGVGELRLNLLKGKENYQIEVENGIGSIVVDNEHIRKDSIYGNGRNLIELNGGVGSIHVNFHEEI